MLRVPAKRAGSLPVKSCPVPGPMSHPIKRTDTSTLKDMSHRKIYPWYSFTCTALLRCLLN